MFVIVEYTKIYVIYFLFIFEFNSQIFNLKFKNYCSNNIISLFIQRFNITKTKQSKIFNFFRFIKFQIMLIYKKNFELNLYCFFIFNVIIIKQFLFLFRISKACTTNFISWYHNYCWLFVYLKIDYEQSFYFVKIIDNIYTIANIEFIDNRLKTVIIIKKNITKIIDAQLKQQIETKKYRIESIELNK